MPTPRSAPSPLRAVLVATDFLPGGDRAVERAARLPLAPSAKLVLLHVLPRLPRDVTATATRHARSALRRAAEVASRLTRERGVRPEIRTLLVSGEAPEEIVLAARTERAELVVLGRHSHRKVRDFFLGSTAHRVVRSAGTAALVVNTDPSAPYERPLAAVDLEVMSRVMLELLVRVLGSDARTVVVLHAFEVSSEAIAFPGFDVSKLSRWGEKFRRQASQRLGEFLAWLPDLAVRWTPVVAPGSASSVVLAEADRRKADLVAVGTHGKGMVSRLFLGSVAERVLAGSRGDVLVARPSRLVRAAPPPGRTAARAKRGV